MTKWERKQKMAKRTARKAAIEKRRDLRVIVRLLAKHVVNMREFTSWQKDRVKILRRALDVLAGEAASS